MRVYLCLPLSGLTCNWLYAFTYAYNLAQSRESGDTTPIEYSGPTTRSHAKLEQTKESEKGEYEHSNIVCKNDQSAKKSVTPGMFVFSCVHHVILGKSLPLFSLMGRKIGFDYHIYPKLIWIN